MGIFICFCFLFLVSWTIACQITPEQDKKNTDDLWWLLTGQEPVKWDKLDEYKTKNSTRKKTF